MPFSMQGMYCRVYLEMSRKIFELGALVYIEFVKYAFYQGWFSSNINIDSTTDLSGFLRILQNRIMFAKCTFLHYIPIQKNRRYS